MIDFSLVRRDGFLNPRKATTANISPGLYRFFELMADKDRFIKLNRAEQKNFNKKCQND